MYQMEVGLDEDLRKVDDNFKYWTEKILGKGRSGNVVFKGLLRMPVSYSEKQVAIKRIQYLGKNEYQNIMKEVKANQEIKHTNFVHYLHATHDENFVYIALELCRGSLAHVMKNQDVFGTPFVPEEVFRNKVQFPKFGRHILFGVAKGLEYLHKIGFVHRDLKPQNVLLKKDECDEVWGMKAAICDLELTRRFKDGRTDLTVTSTQAGTNGWMAPEVLNGETKITNAVDIFAFGCIVHFVLSSTREDESIHPFGVSVHRNNNIVAGKRMSYLWKHAGVEMSVAKSLRLIEHDRDSEPYFCDVILADMLIDGCVCNVETSRLSVDEVIDHPLFWNPYEKINFVVSSYNEFKEPTARKLSSQLQIVERKWEQITDGLRIMLMIPDVWFTGVIHRNPRPDIDLMCNKEMSLLYDTLMRAIRNLVQHWAEIKEQHPHKVMLICKSSNVEDIGNYFFEGIPFLFPAIYLGFSGTKKKGHKKLGWTLLQNYAKSFKEIYQNYLPRFDIKRCTYAYDKWTKLRNMAWTDLKKYLNSNERVLIRGENSLPW